MASGSADENPNSSNEFENEISKKISESLYLDEETADVCFVIVYNDETVKISAHKIVLAKGSEAFHTMFYGSLREGDEVKITDVSAEGVKAFLQFFYLEKVKLKIEHVADVMYLANKYLVKKCMKVCEQFLLKNMKSDYLCHGYQLSITHKLSELKVFCENEISEKSAAVLASDGFKECSHDMLKRILDFEVLSCDGKDMFDACIAWAKQKCQDEGLEASLMNQRNKLGDCLYLIQFGLMSLTQLNQCITTNRGLFNAEELEEIFMMISSNGEVPLKCFKSKTTISQIRQKDLGPLQECARSANRHGYYHYGCYHYGTSYQVHQTEVTAFQTSKTILLCAISFQNVQSSHLPEAIMTITEKAANKRARAIPHLKQKIDFSLVQNIKGRQLELQKTITIKPKMSYEVRINFPADVGKQWYYVTTNYRNTVDLENSYTITFNRSTGLSYDNTFEGICDALYFKYMN